MVERSAGAIIFRMKKGMPLYLLLHYEAGHWDFAKGHIEKGEKIEETIRRETKEEAGIADLRFVPGFKVIIRYWLRPRTRAKLGAGLVQYRSEASCTGPRKTKPASKIIYYSPKQGGIFKFVVFYLAQTKTSKVTLSFEHKGYVWLSYEEAVKKATYKNAKDVLEKADQFLTQREGVFSNQRMSAK